MLQELHLVLYTVVEDAVMYNPTALLCLGSQTALLHDCTPRPISTTTALIEKLMMTQVPIFCLVYFPAFSGLSCAFIIHLFVFQRNKTCSH